MFHIISYSRGDCLSWNNFRRIKFFFVYIFALNPRNK